MRRQLAALVALAAGLSGALTSAPTGASAAPAGDAGSLYLVTLDGPGVSGEPGPLPDPLVRMRLQRQQDDVLARAGVDRAVYRWTTALNGFAARLDPGQLAAVRADPRVALVEPNTRRQVASRTTGRSAAQLASVTARRVGSGRTSGGAGTVIGFVDTGITARHPLFAAVPGLGPVPSRFRDACQPGEGWTADTCNTKLVAARWFVEGFGADRVRAAASLSPVDDDGHGTQVASVAAGNAGVTARVRGRTLGRYAGQAPQARVAAYKACWTAPDPDDDGCAIADVVTAIDRAVRDEVDVLNLAAGGAGSATDTVGRALLGAAEADIVVIAAAGNSSSRFVGASAPWVTTVGGATGAVRRGAVSTDGGPTVRGVMTSTRAVGPAPLVDAARVAARGVRGTDARVCTPGSLDAAQVAGSVVVCERGTIGRVDKSEAVRRAGGVGMVLVNTRPGTVDADLHAVPTVHLGVTAGRELRRWLAGTPRGAVSLRPEDTDRVTPRTVGWTSRGNPSLAVVKPDLVAPATGVLAAVPGKPGWTLAAGTSLAAAHTSGVAARLLATTDWSATAVRSALTTTAGPVAGAPDALASGAGRLRPTQATDPGLVHRLRPRDYRAWLEGTLGDDRAADLNTPSILLPPGRDTARRTITNVGRRALYFSSSTSGFARSRVQVTPAAVRLAPGASATYTVTVEPSSTGRRSDQGVVTWRGARGTTTRVPVVLPR